MLRSFVHSFVSTPTPSLFSLTFISYRSSFPKAFAFPSRVFFSCLEVETSLSFLEDETSLSFLEDETAASWFTCKINMTRCIL